ncbi:MAG: hypothetical protein ETSY2_09075 [Candidatus Entotheonella gemina]|uniref:Uncharacterized protein n=1 Tax=Candidatus Entotheonella gemina TaxID=1429439 RepID=W4MBU8_9BACT|nr:MAG: hypothetical protein ETSY2_09075 [Candidatus Entotheonella gemina]
MNYHDDQPPNVMFDALQLKPQHGYAVMPLTFLAI